ncbi:MAG: ThuA domain-containing protein [Kiritimatiellae bacterium]|nr:ThuA domain-containing protein [Kiritimatiellia bacterium]
MGKSALVMWGGWNGHTPKEMAAILAGKLKENGFDVLVENALTPLEDVEALKKLNLIVPMWTMGELSKEQWTGLNHAVHSAGVGIAGVHGGMGDAFRGHVQYQWLVGGQFLGHPYVGEYTVELTAVDSPITRGMPKSFKYNSEQYYMSIDPAINLLACTSYEFEGQKFKMPVMWTKTWGKGRVFYSALGHVAEEFRKYPDVLEMTTRGMIWAARA